jgi:hypothetical protein
MRKFLLFSCVAVIACAQQTAPPKAFVKTLDPAEAKRALTMGQLSVPSGLWFAKPETEAKTCSIPLLAVKPPGAKDSKIAVRVDEDGSFPMPQVQVPAPACKDWRAE